MTGTTSLGANASSLAPSTSSTSSTPASLAAALAAHPALWRGSELARVAVPSLPSGYAALDAELPGGGWPAASLTEILPARAGIGELRLLGPVLARLSAAGKRLTWVAPPHRPYAPALAAAGIDLSRLIIVDVRTVQEALWATEQALASRACGAVLTWSSAVKYGELRRIQLAAETSRALAVLFRPRQAATDASPAVLRIALAATRGGVAAHILKRRGAQLDRPVFLPASLPAGAVASPHTLTSDALDRHSSAGTAPRSAAARLAAA